MHADQRDVQPQPGLAEQRRGHRDAHLHRVAVARRDGAHRRRAGSAGATVALARAAARRTPPAASQRRHEVGRQQRPAAGAPGPAAPWCGTAAPARRCRTRRCPAPAPDRPARRPASAGGRPASPGPRWRGSPAACPALRPTSPSSPPRGGRTRRRGYSPSQVPRAISAAWS